MPNLVGLVDNPYDNFALEDGQNIKLFDESSLIFERNLPFVGPESPTGAAYRMQQLQEARGTFVEQDIMDPNYEPYEITAARREQFERENPVLTEEEFNKQFKNTGIEYTPDIRLKEAELLAKWKKEETEFKQKMSLTEGPEPIQSFLASFGAQAMDPINLALSIPTLGTGSAAVTLGAKSATKVGAEQLGKYLATTATKQTLLKAAAVGAAENILLNAPAEALVYNSLKQSQADTELYNFWENMLFAAGLGAIMKGGGYELGQFKRGRRLAKLQAERKATLQDRLVRDTYEAYDNAFGRDIEANSQEIQKAYSTLYNEGDVWFRGVRAEGDVATHFDSSNSAPLGRYYTKNEKYAGAFGKVEKFNLDIPEKETLDLKKPENLQVVVDALRDDPAIAKIADVLDDLERTAKGDDQIGMENAWRFLEYLQKETDGRLTEKLREKGYKALRYEQLGNPSRPETLADTLVELLPQKKVDKEGIQEITLGKNKKEYSDFWAEEEVVDDVAAQQAGQAMADFEIGKSGGKEEFPAGPSPEAIAKQTEQIAEADRIAKAEKESLDRMNQEAAAAKEEAAKATFNKPYTEEWKKAEDFYRQSKSKDSPDVTKQREYMERAEFQAQSKKILDELKLCAKGVGGNLKTGPRIDFDVACLDKLIQAWTAKYPTSIVDDLVEGIDTLVTTGAGEEFNKAVGATEAGFQKVLQTALENNAQILRTSLHMGLVLDKAWAKMRAIAGTDRSMSEALGALLVGDYFDSFGVRNSIDARKKSMGDIMHGRLVDRMKKENVWQQFRKGGEAFQRAVANDLWNMTGEIGALSAESMKGGEKVSLIKASDTDSMKAAKIIWELQQEIMQRENSLGANIEPIPNYIVRQSHDPAKIGGRSARKRAIETARRAFGDKNVPKDTLRAQHAAARDRWVADIKERLDLQKTFPKFFNEDGTQTPKQIERMNAALEDVFEDLSRGQHFQQGYEASLNVGRNIAANLSKKRELHFKSADDWFEYNKMYGVGDVFSAISTGIDRAAENIALMEQLGPVPEVTYQALKARIKSETKRGFDLKELNLGRKEQLTKIFEEDLDEYVKESFKPREEVEAAAKTDKFKDREKLERFGEYMLDAFFNEVSGKTRIPGSRTGARFMSGVRTMNVLTKLGGAAISALADSPIIVRETQRQGGNWLQGVGNVFNDIIQKFTRPEELTEFANSLGFGIEAIRNSLLSRFSGPDLLAPQSLRAAQNWLFKITGMDLWNEAHQTGMAIWTSNRLGNMAEKAWADIKDTEMGKLLNMYGISEKKWDLIRKSRVEIEGKYLLDPQAIRSIPAEDILNYIGEPMDLNNPTTLRRIENVKNELELDLATFINDRVDFAVITPSGRETAYMNFGTRPGTPEGEALRFLMQFKSFPITVLSRIVAGDWKREGISGFANFAQLMLGMTAMGYVAMSAKDLTKGRNLRPLNEKTVMAALLQGGALGIIGDLVFGPETRYGHSAFEAMLGPTASMMADLTNIASSWKQGNDTGTQISNFVRNHGIPGGNIWWAKTLIDYGLWYSFQEMNNPGYSRRMKRKIEKEQEQTFWLSPTTDRLRPFK